MSKDAARLYAEVCQHARRTAALASINETLGWDERTHLPPAGGEYRAEQSTLMAGLISPSGGSIRSSASNWTSCRRVWKTPPTRKATRPWSFAG